MHKMKFGKYKSKELKDVDAPLTCSECGLQDIDVILYDMSNHYRYDWDDNAIPLCEKCHEQIWDQV